MSNFQSETPTLTATAKPLTPISSHLKTLGIQSEVLYYGLNFKTTKAMLPGFINKIKKNKAEMDLDISCMLYDAHCQLIDVVWFKSLRDSSQAVRHQGDSLNGKDRGAKAVYEQMLDPEQIEINLKRLPAHVSHIALVLSSYYGQPLKTIKAGEVHLTDDEGNRAFEVDLRSLPDDCNAIWVANLRRDVADWHLTVQNVATDSNNIPKIADFIGAELARALPTIIKYS